MQPDMDNTNPRRAIINRILLFIFVLSAALPNRHPSFIYIITT
jgi:hypothetical protein